MRKFKIIDIAISLTLIFLFLLVSLVRFDETFLIGYCVVGGWQLISIMVHRIKGWFTHKGNERYNYQWTVLIVLFFCIAGTAVMYLLFPVFFLLLFAAPLMALYYVHICYQELTVKMKRPLADLK